LIGSPPGACPPPLALAPWHFFFLGTAWVCMMGVIDVIASFGNK
jgi:hypothetical protein